MSSILDEFPYPWQRREAQQLHMTLSLVHPTVPAALAVAQNAGVQSYLIDAHQAPYYVWRAILDAAADAGVTRELIYQVSARLSPTSPNRPYFAALLADLEPPSEGEPFGVDGAPKFITDNDAVSEPEALLYRDDLTVQIGRVPGLILTLQRLLALAPAVCRFEVDINGTGKRGTGFRIGPDLLLTNWHVLHTVKEGIQATAVTAEFGYETDSRGLPLNSVLIPCNINTIISDAADDWATIRTTEPIQGSWPILRLSDAVAPSLNNAAFIIQHPRGERKRLGFVRNQVSFFDDRVVHYLTDTQEGSSGAPVFNAEGQLIALHHAGGRPQDVLGRAPVKKNEGIRIARIVAGLTAAGVAIP